jgi:DtxR family Mn-dependent transcriptional regulator
VAETDQHGGGRVTASYTGSVPKDALSESIQDYLKAIYQLREADGGVTVSALARRLGVSPASVSEMAKKLAVLELVAPRERYDAIALSPAGEQIAVEVIRHHRLLELYLAETLGVAVEDVHAEADRLEHVLSEELEARIDRALGYPTHDPHGDPIPDAKLEWPRGARRRGGA